jgi:serine/threonine-protein kinase
MPPEQARGEHLDARADVFSLGAILCEILSGSPPYADKCALKCLAIAAKGDVAPVHELLDQSDCDAMLIRLAKRCLSPDPEDRPSDALKVAQHIEQYVDAALRFAESDLARFFELSLDMFCIASFDGYFMRVNSNFSRSLGYSLTELVSRKFMEFVHPDDQESTVQAMKSLISGKPVIRFRNRYRSNSGDYVCMEWTAKSIVEENIVFAVAREIREDD